MMVLMNPVLVKRRNWVEVKGLQQNVDEYMLRMEGEDFGVCLLAARFSLFCT
jgi:hypothetical protein